MSGCRSLRHAHVAALLVLLTLTAWVVAPQHAHAAAQLHANTTRNSTISFEPASGPVDSVVTTTITIVNIQHPVSYILAVTATAPQQGGCARAQPLTHVNPLQVGLPQNGGPDGSSRVQFRWPATLPNTPQATYWFCASPTSADDVALSSTQAFTVLTSAAPAIMLVAPGGQVALGATPKVQISNWIIGSGKEPNIYLVAPHAAAASGRLLSLSLTASDASHGNYLYTWTLADSISPGSYTLLALGDCSNDVCAVEEVSAVFTVLAAPASPPTPPTPNVLSLLLRPAALILVLALLLALLVLIGVARALARRRSRQMRTQQARPGVRGYDAMPRRPR